MKNYDYDWDFDCMFRRGFVDSKFVLYVLYRGWDWIEKKIALLTL